MDVNFKRYVKMMCSKCGATGKSTLDNPVKCKKCKRNMTAIAQCYLCDNPAEPGKICKECDEKVEAFLKL